MYKLNYKLRIWVDIKNIDYGLLSGNTNPGAIPLLENEYSKIDWKLLSKNPNAIHLLKRFGSIRKIDWYNLASNPNPEVIPLIENNLDRLFHVDDWFFELGRNPNAIPLLEKNPDIFHKDNMDSLYGLSQNPNPDAIPLIFKNLDKFDNTAWSFLGENPNFIEIMNKCLFLKNKEILNNVIVYCSNISKNPNAIHFLEATQDIIYWPYLSENPNAISLLEKNQDKINWDNLSKNPNAISLLEKNQDKINWFDLSANPNAIPLLEKNLDKIDWEWLSGNPSIFEPEYQYEYEALKERCDIYKEELMQIAMHPSRIQKILDMGISIDELDNYI
jgi:hypothetical protein